MNGSPFDQASSPDRNGVSESASESISAKASSSPPPKKPNKVLPAKKLSTTKQLEVLRAFAIASTHQRNAVTIQQVADVAQIHPNSVSICNPFFDDIGFVSKQGHKFIPSQPVMEYSDRIQWDANDAGSKLKGLISGTWFYDVIVPRTSLRPITEDEAIMALADACGASPSYRTQLIMLVDYLELCNLIRRENGSIEAVKGRPPQEKPDSGATGEMLAPTLKSEEEPRLNSDKEERFTIPIPGKTSAQIIIPKDLDDSDWSMLTVMLDAYIKRLRAASSTKQEEN